MTKIIERKVTYHKETERFEIEHAGKKYAVFQYTSFDEQGLDYDAAELEVWDLTTNKDVTDDIDEDTYAALENCVAEFNALPKAE